MKTKRNFLSYAVAIVITVPTLFAWPNEAAAQVTSTNDATIRRLEEQLSEIRRDQLNYRIEKDLLKETYSSNYQIVNGALAFFLTAASIIGFLGIRDINALKKDYMAEL